MKPEDKYASPYGTEGFPGPRVNLRGSIRFLNRMRPFNTAHCYARWVPMTDTRSEDERIRMDIKGEKYVTKFNYAVFSGTDSSLVHASPLFVYDLEAQQWFECKDTLYGKVTNRTRKRFRPLIGDTLQMDLHGMQMLLCFGYRHMAILRLNRDRTDWRTEGTITGRRRTP